MEEFLIEELGYRKCDGLEFCSTSESNLKTSIDLERRDKVQ